MALLFGSFLFADMPDDPQKHERDHSQKKLRGIRQNRNFRQHNHGTAKQEEKYPQLVDTPSLQYFTLNSLPVFFVYGVSSLMSELASSSIKTAFIERNTLQIQPYHKP